ncbi:hypothetical protein OG394_04930 [Kribbella sp. NBC_01245]|uniref:hypothetical protein n=1 Tax=Kribbella sp. NBC_01245 TaxID=2903578 RepID=UPI002E2C0B08|nr:hypothetical protein [Kribbella sp. NBC_01245]
MSYAGGTPTTTYQSLLRCALGEEAANQAWNPDLLLSGQSQLWTAITTTQGPLRLARPHVQRWAKDDLKSANAVAAISGPSR